MPKERTNIPSDPGSPVHVTRVPLCVKCGAPEGQAKHYCDDCVQKDLERMTIASKKRIDEKIASDKVPF